MSLMYTDTYTFRSEGGRQLNNIIESECFCTLLEGVHIHILWVYKNKKSVTTVLWHIMVIIVFMQETEKY